MDIKVVVPDLGVMKTGETTIVTWLKKSGEVVIEGEGVAEVTTDKVDAELQAPTSGVLTILAPVGTTVKVGQQIATIKRQGLSARRARSKPIGKPIGEDSRASKPPRPSKRSQGISAAPRDSIVFLCYRREDTQDVADRLHERLVTVYGRARVFMDIDSVPLGVNFLTHIENRMRECAVMLVMIGRNWLRVTDEEGRQRLSDDDDHVRLEIAAALRQGIPVVPLLVQDASMPRSKDLPADIRELAFQNGMTLPRAYWAESVDKLMKKLTDLMK